MATTTVAPAVAVTETVKPKQKTSFWTLGILDFGLKTAVRKAMGAEPAFVTNLRSKNFCHLQLCQVSLNIEPNH